jgi:uncharacterized protein (DUF2236 family)
MKKQIKAIAAAVGGAAAGGTVSFAGFPPDTADWVYALTVVVTTLAPYLATYFGPSNEGA